MSQINTQQMGRLTAAGSKSKIDDVVDALANLNALHFIEYDGSEDGIDLGTPKDEAEIIGKRLSKLRSAASIVNAKGPSEQVPVNKVRSELDGSLIDAVELLLEKSTKLDIAENQLSSLIEQIQVLELLSSLDIDVELLSDYDNITSFVGTVSDIDIVENMGYDGLLFTGISNKIKVIAIFIKNKDSHHIQSKLNNAGFQAINVPINQKGNANSLLSESKIKSSIISEEKKSISDDIDSWSEDFGASLVCGLELLEREHDILTAPVKIGVSNHAFLIDGWIEMSRSNEVLSALADSCLYMEVSPFVIEAGNGGHGHSDHAIKKEMPPIAYANRKISKPMELLTNAVGRPAYGRIDPTLFMLFTYPLFFGMMLGDMAYGLITMSLGALVIQRSGSNEMVNLGGKFLVYIGLGTFGFGYLYAEFAGWEIIHPHHPNPAEALSFLYPDAALSSSHDYYAWHKSLPFGIELAYPFHRVTSNLEDLIILTIYLGFVHIIFGRLIGFRDVLFYGTDHGHVGILAAFFEHGVWIVLLLGGFMFSYGYLGPSEAEDMMIPGAVIAIIAVFMLMWTLYNYHGIPLAISLILAPIEAIGMMPSVISYVRIFAVGIVGVKIAETGNMLWDPMKDALLEYNPLALVLFLGWLLVQLFAWGLGVFSPNIHAARLHFVEWMRQYYDSSGEVFLPFGFRTRHVEVE